MSITLDGHSLTVDEVVRIARYHEPVEISAEARNNLIKARAFVDQAVQDKKVIYGLTTGFGSFKNVSIDPEQTAALQKNLIMSHAIGVGEPLAEECVRASIVVRVNSLLRGYSGIRPLAVDALVALLNKNIYPFVPSKGSVGSSGDLCPLSHIMLVLLGLGEVIVEGKRRPSAEILSEKGLEPIILSSKEGLALNNGTAVQTGVAVLAVFDAKRLAKLADVSLSMSLDAMMGTVRAFDERIHKLRPHPGQMDSAENVRKLNVGSEIAESHKNCGRVQDAYSLRCAAQVHGAAREGIYQAERVLTIEINSVTDNPIVFPDDNDVISGGNFHGEPIALAMDYLSTCVCELGNIAERRVAKMIDVNSSEGLPAYLIPAGKGGLNSGFMIAQYTAAALVSENKVLAHPASVDSIPTSANQEDHVSMGTIAARQAREIIGNVEQVLSIEFLCAAQALDFRLPLKAGVGPNKAFELIRNVVPRLDEDRVLYLDLEKVVKIVRSDEFLVAVEGVVGGLK